MKRKHRSKVWNRLIAMFALVGATSVAAETKAAGAAAAPANRTYFTVAMGLEGRYEVGARCLHFTENGITSLDGEIEGAWRRSNPKAKRAAIAFALSMKTDDGELSIDGQGSIDTRGGGSSVAGAARVRMGRAKLNYAFAGREVSRDSCHLLVEAYERVPVPAGQVVGSGRLATEARFVDGFRAVSLRGTGRLVIQREVRESLSITAEDNILPLLESQVTGGRLELGIAFTGDVRPTRGIEYLLTGPRLEGLSVSGNAEVEAEDVDEESLEVDIQGSARVIAKGRAKTQELRVSGSAAYRAAALESQEVTVQLSGNSHAVVRASDRIVGTLTGSSLLEIFGNPIVEVQTSGTATVVRHGT